MGVQQYNPELGMLNVNTVFLLVGVYGWEYLHSLEVEWALVRGRIPLRPSMIPYLLGRTALLLFLVLFAAGVHGTLKGIDCLPAALTIASLGDISIGTSSMNFLIRTWVIWKDSRIVHALLVFLALGQWTLLVLDVTMISATNVHGVCQIHLRYPQMNAVSIMYSTFFDLFVLVLSVVGLSNQRSESPLKKRLQTQGIAYFAIAGMGYIPPVIASLLGNICLYVLTSNIAITVSTLVSCRAVRSLHAFATRASDAGTPPESSSVTLTTHIGVQGSTFMEDVPPYGRPLTDSEESDRC